MCVEHVDTEPGAVTGYLPLISSPWDIATMGLNQAAITLPSIESIHIISTKPDLSLLRITKADGNCRGICSTTDNKLVVSFTNPRKVQVVDGHAGTVLSEIGGADSRPRLSDPLYVIVVTENGNEVIYVSDYHIYGLTKFSITGQVLLSYKDNDFAGPLGLLLTMETYWSVRRGHKMSRL